MNAKNDSIELRLPFKAEYVSIVRLTASGVANRLGFDLEAIEDIKVAIAEVCNKLVTLGSNKTEFYKITFFINKDELKIVFDAEDPALKCIFNEDDDMLGVSLINALMDNVELCSFNSYLLSMTKKLEGEA